MLCATAVDPALRPSQGHPLTDIAALSEHCRRNPRAPQPWAELAAALQAAGRAAEAVAAAERALALDPAHHLARTARAAAVAQLEATAPWLARLELTAALKPEDAQAQLDLGQAYAGEDRPADAERCFKQALALKPGWAPAHAGLAAAYLSVGVEDGAVHHARLALAAEPGQAVASQALAVLLERQGETAQARAVLDAAYARQSLYVEPAADSRFTVLVLATQTDGNIPYRHLMPAPLYTRLIWFMEHARPERLAQAPPYAVILNAVGDADLGEAARPRIEQVLAASGRPALNAPDKVARTRRDRIGTLLGDISGVLVPPCVRLDAQTIAAHGLAKAAAVAGLQAPLLARPAGSHGGRGLTLAQDAAALDALAWPAGEDAYVTAFHDYRGVDGGFRKGRMVFVDRRPLPYHWAVSDHWLVHYESAGMGERPDRRAEEAAFLADPAAVIGEAALAAIACIGERLDLDYGGVDFSLLPDGRVLVFEANATMFVHPEAADGAFAYKNPAVTRIADAFQAHLARLAGEGARA